MKERKMGGLQTFILDIFPMMHCNPSINEFIHQPTLNYNKLFFFDGTWIHPFKSKSIGFPLNCFKMTWLIFLPFTPLWKIIFMWRNYKFWNPNKRHMVPRTMVPYCF